MNRIDQDIINLRKRKDMLIALERLSINSDFQKVIGEYYLTLHPLELVKSKGQLPLDPELNASIDRQLDAVALFGMYLENTRNEIDSIDLKIEEALTYREQQTRNT